MKRTERSLSYRDAGVDREAADRFTERVAALAETTATPELVRAPGGFASLLALPPGFVDPLLVTSTDGVGTKLALALAAGRPELIGRDLVAMCLNDVVTTGAVPLSFLDYLAVDKIEGSALLAIVAGMAEACREAGCVLAGGETAEMPGLVPRGGVEVAGFALGVVERARLLSPGRVVAGDALLGIRTTGLHANGYSLVRKVMDNAGLRLDEAPSDLGMRLADALLRPTPLYVRAARALAEIHGTHALAHVTGGGLVRNTARLLTPGLVALVDEAVLVEEESTGIIGFLARRGPIARDELRRTFPCGVGFVAALSPEALPAAESALEALGERTVRLGVVAAAQAGAPAVVHFR